MSMTRSRSVGKKGQHTVSNIPFLRDIQIDTVGSDVTALKRALIRWNATASKGVVVNNSMGADADAALKAFQTAEKLTADGVMGPTTYAKLCDLSLFDAYSESLLEAEQDVLEGSYKNPFRAIGNLGFDGYDQGVDFFGNGQVYAAGPGKVTVATQSAGWPGGGAVAYTLTSGKAAGKSIYFAENITVHVKVGDVVSASTIIATLLPGFPHCETGWSEPGTDNPLAQPITSNPTAYGVNFGRFLISLGEKTCPLETGGGDEPLPAGWPAWV